MCKGRTCREHQKAHYQRQVRSRTRPFQGGRMVTRDGADAQATPRGGFACSLEVAFPLVSQNQHRLCRGSFEPRHHILYTIFVCLIFYKL